MTTLTAPISTMFHAHGAGRSCCRCSKELTDAASMEAGIGPVCRKQDNTLLANSIPANPPEALMHFLGIDIGSLVPETVNTVLTVKHDLAANLAGTDWRKVIKRIEWILSFEDNRKVTLGAFSNVARSLGYLGLAALWNGEASTGQATVWFANGRLYVAGPRNMAARFAFKKAGGRFLGSVAVPNVGNKPAWYVEHNGDIPAFATAIQTHYPVNIGLTDSLAVATAYAAQVKATPAPVAPTPPTAPTGGSNVKHRIEQRGSSLSVFTPYDAGFIADLKATVPYAFRSWEPAAKCWKVESRFLSAVSELILKHYKTQPAVLNMEALEKHINEVTQHVGAVAETIAPTPQPAPPAPAQVVTKVGAEILKKPTVLPF